MEPGVLGFLIVAGLGIVLFFLLKNMNKQFKKLGPPPAEKGADVSMKIGEAVRTGDAEQDQRAAGAAKRQ